MSAWVLLRGLARERRHWGDFPAQLQAAGVASTVVSLDLPGNGALNHETSPLRVAAMADWVAQALARRNIAPPYRVLGLSLGGMVAVAWAHARPQQLAAMVLVNTSLRPFCPFYRRLRPGAWRPLLGALVATDVARRERAILALTSNDAARAEAVFPDWLAWAQARPVSSANALRQLIAAARYRAPAEPPAVPTLVLASGADRMVAPACSRALAAQWQWPLVEHPRAGHDLPLDDGAWMAREIACWLAGAADG
jgi:pimeloyl-ACP methyl ester carboxylesterase